MFRRDPPASPANITPYRPQPDALPVTPAAEQTQTRPGGRTLVPARPGTAPLTAPHLVRMRDMLRPVVFERLRPSIARALPQKEVAGHVSDVLIDYLDDADAPLDLTDQRQLVAVLVNELLTAETDDIPFGGGPAGDVPVTGPRAQPGASSGPSPRADATLRGRPAGTGTGAGTTLEDARRRIKPLLMERIDFAAASALDPDALVRALSAVVTEVRDELHLQLNAFEQTELVRTLVDDMVGLGPLEPLLADETVTDIMVNGANQIYCERGGKLTLTDVRFQDDQHVMNIATRIVTRVGRRVDESSPICDARLPDGSRVNVIIPPLAIDGPSISIRKFSRRRITLDVMGEKGNLSPVMAKLLKIAARSRLNIVISGGTGSGKTTLLNALSQMIDHGERVVTIEDAAELQLQQPHVVRLETRPPNLEGKGEVTMRGLVKNALRMRPDRIILGEVRGPEAVDMLQAMNTGHEGSMCTLHANKPRDTLVRMENMISMAVSNLPPKAIRAQIASAVDLIVQISRMRDGTRRITDIVEVVGMEGDVIITQELFTFQHEGEDDRGRLRGRYVASGVRPHFLHKAEYFGLGQALLECV